MTDKIKIERGIVTEITYIDYFESLKNKNIIRVGGCFCPPHKGHYNLIKNSIITGAQKIDEPVDIAIITHYQTAAGIYNSRHGIPYSQNLSMMILYLQKLSEELHETTFYLAKDNGDAEKDVFFGTEVPIDVNGTILTKKIITVLSNENQRQGQIDKSKQGLLDVKKFAWRFPPKFRKNIMDHQDYVSEQLIEKMVLLVVSDRDKSGPSATQFTKFLRNAPSYVEIPQERLDFFFPETITVAERIGIISEIQEKYYNKKTFFQCIKGVKEKQIITPPAGCLVFYPKVEEFIETNFPDLKDTKVKDLSPLNIQTIIDMIIQKGYRE